MTDSPTFTTPEKPKRAFYRKKRVIIPTALVGLFIVVGATSGGSKSEPAKAQAATPSATTTEAPKKAVKAAVTLAQYDKVQNGMSLAEVEGIFGGAKATSNSSSEIASIGKIDTMSWNGDGFGDSVIIQFGNDKVTSKSQYGLG